MIDFHSHILPDIDDGSKSIEMSCRMLEAEKEQGITHVVATPHFYASKDDPKDFLERRNRAYLSVRSFYEGDPQIILGAEVYYYRGISKSKWLDYFCIGDSNAILIEMPFEKWSDFMLSELIDIEADGYIPIIAHAERYLKYHNKSNIKKLIENDILIQANASFFIDERTSKKAFRMLRQGMIHLLGSDCHNMSSRMPDVGDCLKLESRRTFRRIETLSESILGLNKELIYY